MVKQAIPLGMRRCLHCREIKTAEEFFEDKRRGGRRARCKICTGHENSSRRSENHEKYLAIEKTSKTKSRQGREVNSSRMWRRWQVVKKFGMTLQDFDNRLSEQDNKCAICLDAFSTEILSRGHKNIPCLDHDHDTGIARGILCNSCNIGIGRLGDNSTTILRAAEYLKRHGK